MSILVVWVNHLINLKVQFIISKSQRIKEIKNKEKQRKMEESLFFFVFNFFDSLFF